MYDDDEFIAKYESSYLTSKQSREEIFSSTFEDGQELFELLDSITQNENLENKSKKTKIKTSKSDKNSVVSKSKQSSDIDSESEYSEIISDSESQIEDHEIKKPPKIPKIKNKTSLKQDDSSEIDSWSDLKGKVIAQLNRLSEGNIRIIIDELSGIISSLNIQSGKLPFQITLDLSNLIIQFSISNDQVQPSVIVAYTGLICWLSSISPEICYLFIDKLYNMLRDSIVHLSNSDKNERNNAKSISKNCIVSLASLYHFGILDLEILCDIIHLVTDRAITDDLSYVIITLIRYCGQIINFKSPQLLKQILSHIQSKIDDYKTTVNDFSKSVVRFLELEIKDNKPGNNTLPIDNMKETLKRHFNIALFVSKINFYNFINSPYKNTDPSQALKHVSTDYSHIPTSQSNETTQLLSKASSLGLSNSIQKSVFLTLMRSCDSIQAVKIITNNYPNKNNILNIVKTIITCMLAERDFNPFYIKVIEHLNKFGNKAWNKSFKYTLRSTIHTHLINSNQLSKRKKGILDMAIDSMIGCKLIDEDITNQMDN